MEKTNIRRRRPFYDLFLKMTLILLIPLTLILGIFTYALEKVVLRDYEVMNTQMIDEVSRSIDQSVSSQINMAYSLRMLDSLKQLSANLLENTVEVQKAYRELRSILACSIYNDLAETVAVYFPEQNRVVSTDGSVSLASDFYTRYVGYEQMTDDEFYSLVESTKGHCYLPAAYASAVFKPSRDIVTYIQPIQLGYLAPRACYLAVITGETLTRRVLGSFEGGAQFRLIDESGAELYRSAGVQDGWSAKEASGSVRDADRVKYRVFTPETLSCGLRLVFYVPESAVMRSINRFVLICILAMAACVIVGLLLANRLTWQLYTPYRELLTTSFPEGLDGESPSMGEGFRLIAGRMLETRQMNSRFQKELQTYFTASRDNALINLMIRCAYLSDEELSEAAELCKLPVSYYSYQLALFKSPTAEFELPEANAEADEDAVLLTARLSGRQFVAIAARAGKDAPDPLEGLIAQSEGAFRVGKSRAHGSIRDLGRCISEADAAFRAEKAPARATDSLYYPIERELQLIAATRDGLYPDVSRLLTDIRDYNLAAAPGDEAREADLYGRLCVTALKAIEQTPAELRASLEEEAKRLQASQLTGEARFREILAFYERLCGATSNDIHQKNQAVIENVREYLNERYADPTLCLDSVAEHLGVSYYFLSRIFKSETNQSFSDLLGDVRVYRAMELLRTTALPVQEVCAQVGYTNWSTFLRAFRKRAGTTPLQYRNLFGAK